MPIVMDKLCNVCGELQLVFSCGKCGFQSVEDEHCQACDMCYNHCECKEVIGYIVKVFKPRLVNPLEEMNGQHKVIEETEDYTVYSFTSQQELLWELNSKPGVIAYKKDKVELKTDYSQNEARLILQGKDTLGNTNPDGWLNTYLLNRNNSDLPASWMGYVLQNEIDLPQLPHEKTMKSSEFYDYIMNVISEAGYDLSIQDHGAGGYFQHEPNLQISLGYVIVKQWVGYDR